MPAQADWSHKRTLHTEWSLEPGETYSQPLEMVRKTENSKSICGAMPVFLTVPECHQKFPFGPTTATKFALKKKKREKE